MRPEIKLELPAPWACGVVLGFVPAVLQPASTTYRGLVRIEQTKSQKGGGFRQGIRALTRTAKKQGVDLADFPWGAFSLPGHVGWAWLVRCSPRVVVPFETHQNAGSADDKWVWFLENPCPVSAGEPKPRAAQPVLFAG